MASVDGGLYDKFPWIPVGDEAECGVGWDQVCATLHPWKDTCICVECYPGVDTAEIAAALEARIPGARILRSEECFKPAEAIEAMVRGHLTDDPVFGRMNGLTIDDFLARERVAQLQTALRQDRRPVIVVGTGASRIVPDCDCLIYADLARWEIQQRQRRRQCGNLGADNLSESPSLKYKRAFFVDWRVADRLKKQVMPQAHYLLDTREPQRPRMISGRDFRKGLEQIAHQPFRLVPFFDPGPWGGQWMREVCRLDGDAPNFAWCFDCVPEENSLLLGFGQERVEIPAIDLVFFQPQALLGEAVHARFGTEFPIRFDFLDTMGGGNLSLQVHPLTEYIQDKFGMHYTQDESYYLLDAKPNGAVYLGLKEDIDRRAMATALARAQAGGEAFPASDFVNAWPARKHDHFLIPAGTIHCSGKDTMVLEISATPYIFTFKMWDWGRMGLDGRPRPIHLDHGLANVQWERTTNWVRRELINRVEPVAEGPGWKEERTGLHEREFIETRRHWFSAPVQHHTGGGVNVLNLVEGSSALVESPDLAFPPLLVHYAETFVVPASVGAYTIRPLGSGPCATLKAFVRTGSCV